MTLLKPPGITFLYLFFLYILAVLLKDSGSFFVAELLRFLVLGATFIVPSVLYIKLKKGRVHWENILITFVILLLLADTSAPLFMIAGLGFATAIAKLFLRIQGHPVINPAVAGLITLYFLGLTTTWWGASFAPRFTQLGISSAMLITLPLGLFIVWKYQKVPTLIATVVGLILTSLILGGRIPWQLLAEGTFAFFLFIMATEPKTTPVIDAREWVYGALLGISLQVWFYFKLPLPYLLNLLILNIGFSLYKFAVLKRTLKKE